MRREKLSPEVRESAKKALMEMYMSGEKQKKVIGGKSVEINSSAAPVFKVDGKEVYGINSTIEEIEEG